jgi:hypothetical protein
MANLVRGDTLVVSCDITDIDAELVARVGLILENGLQKIVEAPETLVDITFIWDKEETIAFPIRNLRARLFVETTDGKRFTLAETAINIQKEFKEKT